MILFAKLPGAKWWTLLTILASLAIVVSNAIYFDGGPTPRFLLEKGSWAQTSWWLATFYAHIAGASICLLAGTPLMFPCWTSRHRAWHRRLGYVYFNAVLWVAAPSGLALATTAKGGVWGTVGFAVAGILWWQSTWAGYLAIRRGDIPAHIRAMIRSYAWALSAPAFRVVQIALFACGLPDQQNYLVSLWLSVAASVWLAEACIQRCRPGTIPAIPVSNPLSLVSNPLRSVL